MNIDEMQAGPEMDRAIQSRVFGRGDGQGWKLNFQPSTNIAHAWEVVEKLNEPWVCRLPDDTWECETRGAIKAWALTAPLAICRAALKAVRG